ncbi:MAG: hypothetical protein M1319_05755 [Chloroflexi bacterium]|nr:hypothetical protein [Chloroflexota bacterium]
MGLDDIKLKVSLITDENGYLGRECPIEECKGYFKVLVGTGLEGVGYSYCPYCGHKGDHNTFYTQDQMEYIRSAALNAISDELGKQLKKMEFSTRPSGPFGISISLKHEHGRRIPIHRYKEKALETYVECPNCGLKYAVYGVFGFCPDCGQHNSLEIFRKSLELIEKMLEMAASVEPDLAAKLVEDALENCVSEFDGFGRELCHRYAQKSSDPVKAERISFQNLEVAKQGLATLYGIDMEEGVSEGEWKDAIRWFQKRHLLSHSMGVVDEEHIRKANDNSAILGRKVIIEAEEVRQLMGGLGKLADFTYRKITHL